MEEQILDIDEGATSYHRKVATKGIRFANMLVDTLLIGIPVSFLANFILFGEAITTGPSQLSLDNQLKTYALNMAIYMVYYIVMEHNFGKTIGKMMTNTRVVTHSGGKPTFGQIVGRSFARYIPFEAFSFLGDTGIGWHDSLTGTYVITDTE